jgi:hypothetical protein
VIKTDGRRSIMPFGFERRKKEIFWIIPLSLICLFFMLFQGKVALSLENGSQAIFSEKTEECLDCHRVYTPGIVEDWIKSAHAKGIAAESKKKPELERKVSSPAGRTRVWDGSIPTAHRVPARPATPGIAFP